MSNSKAVQEARCSGWKMISYSASGDTAPTIQEIRIHNQLGRNKKCWK